MLMRGGSELPPNPFRNGRFVGDPQAGGILWTTPMDGPENNELVVGEMGEVVAKYPYATCLICDRACEILKGVKKRRLDP